MAAAASALSTLSSNMPLYISVATPSTSTSSGGGSTGGGSTGGGSGSGGSTGGGSGSFTPVSPAFYVSPTGSDSNPGTASAPFLTLAKAQSAMAGSSTKFTYVRAGTYNLGATITLGSADANTTYHYYDPDGVNSAVIDGGGTVDLFEVNANGITFNGLKMQNCNNYCIHHDDGSTSIQNLTITNCDIGHGHGTTGGGGFPGLILINGVNGATVTHNYVHDAPGNGMKFLSFQAGLVVENVVVDSNVVLNTCTGINDEGGIYFELFNNYVATSNKVTNNYVKDYGHNGGADAHGIYLDEGTNHVTISGNVIGPPAAGSGNSTGMFLADGYDNVFKNNICDLGPSGTAFTGVWWYPGGEGFTPQGNQFINNIVISKFAGNQNTSAFGNTGVSYSQTNQPAGDPSSIANNMYHNYGGGQVRTDGNAVSDSSPQLADPQVSGWTYTIAAGSPAFSAPVSFTDLTRGWGPPGFTIPQTGTTPSGV